VKPGRRAALAATLAGASLAAMTFASRLPAGLDFISPRRFGFALYEAAAAFLAVPANRTAFTLVVTAGLLAGTALALTVLHRRRDEGYRQAVAASFLAYLSFEIYLEVSQLVWFPYGCLNPFEIFFNLVVFTALTYFALTARGDSLLVWFGANSVFALLAFFYYDAWTSFDRLYAAPSKDSVFVVLVEHEGRPDRLVYPIPGKPADAALDQIERYSTRPSVHRLPALRSLYEGWARAQDPESLRRALLRGVSAGDPLARVLLLEHALSAPPSDAVRAALGALADERVHRVGPMGAARLAQAYARQGDRAQAAVWVKKASPAIPEGLIALPEAAAVTRRISGRVEGPVARVGLYRRPDAAAPQGLDASALVAAAAPEGGRFSFAAPAGGRYYLALRLSPDAPRGEVLVRGHRGDIRLDARRTSVDLPPLSVKVTP
jgi:hypothetical protein